MAEPLRQSFKVGAAAFLFFLTFGCSYLPFVIKSFKTNKLLVSLSNCFAGGVFLSAGLIHILPDALESWGKDSSHSHSHSHDHDEKHDEGETEPFPWVSFSMLASFSLILLIDRVLLPGHHGHDKEEDEEHTHAHGHDHDHSLGAHTPDSQQEPMVTLDNAHYHHQHGHTLGPFMLVIAMGVHAVFEGLALGLMNDTKGFLGFMAAIVFHKWAESVAIGISFLKNKVPFHTTLIGLGIFAFLTPIGVGIGLIFSSANSKLKAILLAVSAGTFLYIAIAEILSDEFAKKKSVFKRYTAYLAGAALMIFVWYIEQLGGHSH